MQDTFITRKEIKENYRDKIHAKKCRYRRAVMVLRHRLKAELSAFDSSPDAAKKRRAKREVMNPPKRPVLEEIGNAVTHGVGSIFAIFALVMMLLAADNLMERISAIVYSSGMCIMFTSSCLYHSFAHGSAVKRLFHRFDYSAIYVLIGATFVPVLLCYFGDTFGFLFLIIQWLIIVSGITFVGIFGPKRLSFLHIPLYVVLGWSALMLLPGMFEGNPQLAMWILAGGVVYTLGIIPFAMKSRASHFIWHFFVLAGAVTQWIGIYLYLYK